MKRVLLTILSVVALLVAPHRDSSNWAACCIRMGRWPMTRNSIDMFATPVSSDWLVVVWYHQVECAVEVRVLTCFYYLVSSGLKYRMHTTPCTRLAISTAGSHPSSPYRIVSFQFGSCAKSCNALARTARPSVSRDRLFLILIER